MGDFAEIAGCILSRVERRVEAASQNIANVSTPGYKRAVSFETLLNPNAVDGGENDPVDMWTASFAPRLAIDTTPGKPQNTGNPGDLALVGAGFFGVRSQDGALLYTRQGQFHRDAFGHQVNAQGGVLQQSGGGDLVLSPGDFKVLEDGTVLQAGDPVARVAVFNLSRPDAIAYSQDGLYTAPDETVSALEMPSLTQGALEASNVSLGTEMITMMAALREAQSGQRVMSVYDDLMGRAITTFGQG